ncbi:hypothetical protein E2C01_040806 [Portunus trituberculatus]|uniref:Uncharacterized protein n=1 Tax=Portunus trituberculatus TaxID=210409 RepID=A0A5B7FID4_PORTR|nr:hypothetical protein [Portunus trituberculatus]
MFPLGRGQPSPKSGAPHSLHKCTRLPTAASAAAYYQSTTLGTLLQWRRGSAMPCQIQIYCYLWIFLTKLLALSTPTLMIPPYIFPRPFRDYQPFMKSSDHAGTPQNA